MYAIGDDQILRKVFAQMQPTGFNAYLLFEGKILFEEVAKLNFDEVISNAFGR